MHIKIRKGLDLPISKPSGLNVSQLEAPTRVALNVDPFDDLRFKMLVKIGDRVKTGQPILESKKHPSMAFVSPATGVIHAVRRGHKRRLLDVIIEVAEEEFVEHGPLGKADLVQRMLEGGIFPHIRMRPFDLIASPKHMPRAIFVQALDTRPLAPPPELQLKGNEDLYKAGLKALATLSNVHVVCRPESPFEQLGGGVHTASGPHPAGDPSVHIHSIAPIRHEKDIVWTLDVLGVIALGELVLHGRYFNKRVIAIGGDGVVPERVGYYQTQEGIAIADLIANRITDQPQTFISGDPLTGTRVEAEDFLGFYDTTFSVIPLNVKRQMFHFLRFGGKFSATRTYFPTKNERFTTNQHGEERAFIDASIYNKVMPMRIPTVPLVKAILAEDFELAVDLGLLEVAPVDFALSTFICPSKIEMIDIVKRGLHTYSKELGH